MVENKYKEHMSFHKTTSFYEMQIRRILEEYKDENIPAKLKQDLIMMIQNANSPHFQEWLKLNNAEEYK